MSFVNLMVLV